jgi:hypothetical protein
VDKEISFSNSVKFLAGSDVEVDGVKYPLGAALVAARLEIRDYLERVEKKASEGSPRQTRFGKEDSG